MANEKHLEIIHSSVNRLATHSFYIKGWSITITTALVGFVVSKGDCSFLKLALIPAIAFWLLDGYYLGVERRFVALYDAAAREQIDTYIIQPNTYTSFRNSIIGGCFSLPVLLFHATVAALVIIALNQNGTCVAVPSF